MPMLRTPFPTDLQLVLRLPAAVLWLPVIAAAGSLTSGSGSQRPCKTDKLTDHKSDLLTHRTAGSACWQAIWAGAFSFWSLSATHSRMRLQMHVTQSPVHGRALLSGRTQHCWQHSNRHCGRSRRLLCSASSYPDTNSGQTDVWSELQSRRNAADSAPNLQAPGPSWMHSSWAVRLQASWSVDTCNLSLHSRSANDCNSFCQAETLNDRLGAALGEALSTISRADAERRQHFR